MSLPGRLLGLALLLGTVLLGIGAAMHPVLTGDGAAQLRIIAATPYWRAIHLLMLAGTGLVIAGIWVRPLFERSEAREALLAALAIVTAGEAINALNIAYMASAGTHLAQRFQAGDEAAPSLYDATHLVGLMAARFGNYLVALGALMLGWAEWRGSPSPRLFAALAWLAAVAGIAGVLLFHEASRFTLTAITTLTAWQVVIGIWALAISETGAGSFTR